MLCGNVNYNYGEFKSIQVTEKKYFSTHFLPTKFQRMIFFFFKKKGKKIFWPNGESDYILQTSDYQFSKLNVFLLEDVIKSKLIVFKKRN